MMKRTIALLLAAMLLMMSASMPGAAAEELTLDERVDDAFADARTIGGAFVVAHRGEIVYERYYGMRHKNQRNPVTPETYFRCASVTKLVTGIGLLRMMDMGLLDPDEDISTYLGYTVRNAYYRDTPITLRMLMSHTSSIYEGASFMYKSRLLRDALDIERKGRYNFSEVRPGTQYTYSNFGAGVTGSIMETVMGKDVCGAMDELVFDALGIDAAYNVHLLDSPDDISGTYNKDGSLYTAPQNLLRQPYTAECLPDEHYRMTAGSLWIRPHDLARLGIAICGDGSVDGVQLISEDAIAMMREPNSKETTGITDETPYSFFCIRRDNVIEGHTVYGHQGTDEGIVCNLYFEPENELVVCVMINGCKAYRDDGVMSVSRRLTDIAWDEFVAGGEM